MMTLSCGVLIFGHCSKGSNCEDIKPMVTSEFSKTMCGGINVLKNIVVPWDLTCDEIIYVLEGMYKLIIKIHVISTSIL